jgi:hypothetical protein
MKYQDMFAEGRKVGAIKTLTPTYFSFEKPQDGFVGRFKGRSAVDSSLGGGQYHQYLFDTDDGLIKCAFGQATDKEAGAMMEVGRVYVIDYQGQVKITGGRSVNKFTIDLIDESALDEAEKDEDKVF